MEKSRKFLGFISCFFLGILGLLIGVIALKGRARSTFIKGWVSCLVLCFIIAAAFFAVIIFAPNLIAQLYEATGNPMFLELLRLAQHVKIG